MYWKRDTDIFGATLDAKVYPSDAELKTLWKARDIAAKARDMWAAEYGPETDESFTWAEVQHGVSAVLEMLGIED
jgi:hypothetical protein